jgi:flagellar L-ring protein FlgH
MQSKMEVPYTTKFCFSAAWRLCVSKMALRTLAPTCIIFGTWSYEANGQDASLLLAPVMPPAVGPVQPGTLSLANSSFIYRPMPPESIQRELQINDIVTVLVDYRSSLMSEAEANSQRTMDFTAVLADWLKFDGKNIMPAPQRNGDPTIAGELDSQYQTDADVSATDMLTFRIAATVVDIRPNGNLVIEAHSEVQHNEEMWEQSLSGVVRRQSIGPDRTVRSDDVAERRIRIRKKGFVRDGTERGWFLKWYDCWKPF